MRTESQKLETSRLELQRFCNNCAVRGVLDDLHAWQASLEAECPETSYSVWQYHVIHGIDTNDVVELRASVPGQGVVGAFELRPRMKGFGTIQFKRFKR
jgi:hypothetical protein